jgi:hypothetical protein
MATSSPAPVDFFTGESVPVQPQQGQYDPTRSEEFVNAVTRPTAEQAEAEALALGRAQALARFGGENTTAFGPVSSRIFIQSNKDPGQPGFNNPRIPLRLTYIATVTVRASPAVLPTPVPAPAPPPPPPPEPSQLNVDPFDVPEFETLIEPPDLGPPVTEPVPVDLFLDPIGANVAPPVGPPVGPSVALLEPEPVNLFLDPIGANVAPPVGPSVALLEPVPVDLFLDPIGANVAPPTAGVDTNPSPPASNTVAGKDNTIFQPARSAITRQPESGDWRVRISLADNANYLYKDPNIISGGGSRSSVLAPLALTDGVLFPYTPEITTAYRADYDNYSLTHSNYRGYFYKSSFVDAVNISADFTAQDTSEANYMLAMIHFFRSVTKMFYGRDIQAGAPPPMVYLNGLGQFQYNNHPCLVSQFNYSLPNNVDYVRAGSVLNLQQNLLTQRPRASIATNPISNAVNRLRNAFGFVPQGGQQPLPQPPTLSQPGVTYVPTKISIQLTLLPVQTRGQVSKEFNLKDYASGALLKKGYW